MFKWTKKNSEFLYPSNAHAWPSLSSWPRHHHREPSVLSREAEKDLFSLPLLPFILKFSSPSPSAKIRKSCLVSNLMHRYSQIETVILVCTIQGIERESEKWRPYIDLPVRSLRWGCVFSVDSVYYIDLKDRWMINETWMRLKSILTENEKNAIILNLETICIWPTSRTSRNIIGEVFRKIRSHDTLF